jgi:hypothetical protein
MGILVITWRDELVQCVEFGVIIVEFGVIMSLEG